MIKTAKHLASALFSAAVVTTAAPSAADTLSTVQERGSLNCPGHNGSYYGLAEIDDEGNWRGLDIDLCRALASAIFGTYEGHLNIIPISWAQRWPLLNSGELDAIIKTSDWTASRDAELNLQFTNIYIFSSQRLMVRKELNASSIADLEGGSVCLPAGTSVERFLANYLASENLAMEFVSSETSEEVRAAYLSGRCDALAEWDVQLAVTRSSADDADEHIILPDVFGGGPTAMIVRENDARWLDVVNFMLSTLLTAEQEGITQANVDEMKANPSTPAIAKMLGVTPGFGTRVGLSDDFAYDIIKNVGNYSEIWERNLGQDSPYKLERGMNALWQDGGVLWPIIMD